MIRVCAFDLGNTLVDDAALYDRSLGRMAELLAERRVIDDASRFVSVYDRINAASQMPFVSHTFGEVEFFERSLAELGATGISAAEALSEYRRLVLEETRLEPEIRAALAFLGEVGLRRAILSNEREARVEGFLTATDSRSLFETVFVSERYGAEKPDRGFFEAALAEMGAVPEEVLMFGDNTIADGAARELGMGFVYVEAFATQRWYFERGEAYTPDFTLPAITVEGLRRCLAHFGTQV